MAGGLTTFIYIYRLVVGWWLELTGACCLGAVRTRTGAGPGTATFFGMGVIGAFGGTGVIGAFGGTRGPGV